MNKNNLSLTVIAISLAFSFGIASHASAATGCNYYASPNGGGNGLSQTSPFQIASFWAVGSLPGKTLCLLNGTYTDANSNIYPNNTAIDGIAGNPITVKALNDGQVWIDGQNSRTPILLVGNSYFIIEGINAYNSSGGVVRLSTGANNNIIRRVVAWDALDENQYVVSVSYSSSNLFEDVGAFGVGRKTFGWSQDGNSTTCRRCWGRWEGSTNVGPTVTFEIVYNNNNNLWENIIGTWDNGSMPGDYWLQNNGVLYTDRSCSPSGCHITDFGKEQPYGVIAEGDPAVTDANATIKGSIAYVRSADRFDAAAGVIVHTGGTGGGIHLENVVSYMEPSGHSSKGAIALPGSDTETNLSASNMTGIGGIADSYGSNYTGSNRENATTVGSVSSIYTGGAGADVCFRYVNGTLTSTPLWPWPMNQRILDATTLASASNHQHYIYQGNPPALTLVTDPHAPVDVTATIENMFGAIPTQCKGSGAPPPPPSTCTNLLNSTTAVPTNFAASFNWFSSAKELLMNVICSGSGNLSSSATANIGNGSNTQYIYKTGYVWQNNQWTSFNYSGQSMDSGGNWFIGSANHSLGTLDLTQKQSVLSYICDWNGLAWRCGCHDSSCTTGYWNLQQFKQ